MYKPDDVLHPTKKSLSVDVENVAAEAYLSRDVSAVGQESEVDVSGAPLGLPVIVVHLEHDSRGVSEQEGVVLDAQSGVELF